MIELSKLQSRTVKFFRSSGCPYTDKETSRNTECNVSAPPFVLRAISQGATDIRDVIDFIKYIKKITRENTRELRVKKFQWYIQYNTVGAYNFVL